MKDRTFEYKMCALSFVGVIVCLTAIMVNDYINRLEDNLRDIDQRLTILEQSLGETDKAVVKALQGCNEALYELKINEQDGRCKREGMVQKEAGEAE